MTSYQQAQGTAAMIDVPNPRYGCNLTNFSLFGAPRKAIDALNRSGQIESATLEKILRYSDGYKARSWFMLDTDLKAEELQGYCFGNNPNKRGAMCHTILAGDQDGKIATRGHQLTWLMAKDWEAGIANNSTIPELRKGNPLDETTANGAILRPKIGLDSVEGGATRGKLFKVEWFQPKQNHYYYSFVPQEINLEESFRSYSTSAVDPEWPIDALPRGSLLDKANDFWEPTVLDTYQFVIMDFGGILKEVTGITLQGDQVTQVRVEYSQDGRRTWKQENSGPGVYDVKVKEDDPDGKVYIRLNSIIFAQALKVIPIKWKKTIRLRLSFNELKKVRGGVWRFSAREKVDVFCIDQEGKLHQQMAQVTLTNATSLALTTATIASFLFLV